MENNTILYVRILNGNNCKSGTCYNTLEVVTDEGVVKVVGISFETWVICQGEVRREEDLRPLVSRRKTEISKRIRPIKVDSV